jgi:hypothetical protein
MKRSSGRFDLEWKTAESDLAFQLVLATGIEPVLAL